MRNVRKNLAGAFLIAATLLAPSPAAAQKQSETITVALAGVAFYWILHYVAEGAGLFQEEGLKVEQVTLPSGSRMVATVMGGSSDVTEVNMADSLNSAARGSDLVNIAAVYGTIPLVVFLSNDAIRKTGITENMPIDEKMKRLKDLKIGITSPGSGTDQLIRTLFLVRGIDPDRAVSLQPLGQGASMLAALEQGAIDGFVFAAPFPQIAESKGLGKTVISPFKGEAPELRGVTYMGVATSRATLNSKRPQLRAYVRALTKALKLARERPDEARKVVRKYFPDMSEDLYRRSFDEALLGLPTTTDLSEDQLRRTIAMMNLTAQNPIALSYKDVIFPDFARDASKDILAK